MLSKILTCSFLLGFTALIQAQEVDLTQGIVIEGESLPVGVSLNDTRNEVETTLFAFDEFNNDQFECGGRRDSFCTFTAIDAAGNELGSVTVRYRNATASSDDDVRDFFWTFPDWITSAGVSLSDLSSFSDSTILEELYPDLDRALVSVRSSSTLVSFSSRADGLSLFFRSSAFSEIARGHIFEPL